MAFKYVICFALATCVLVDVNSQCDRGVARHNEGVVGETSSFPWLGVLRVHMHEGRNFSVAITGMLLVRRDYAIVGANDMSKVHKNYLKRECKAMFIITDHERYFCGVKDYFLHPEYDYTTSNTIALLQLDSDNSSSIPTICWQRIQYKGSHQLYAIGFTDRNKLLEKVIYKMEDVNNTLCHEFYDRVGLDGAGMTGVPLAHIITPQAASEKPFVNGRGTKHLHMLAALRAPVVASSVNTGVKVGEVGYSVFRSGEDSQTYICAYSRSNKGHCEWDNGMVLATNSTGYWRLIGYGVQGPGCSAPARFIDMYSHFQWIEDMIKSYN